MNISVHSHIRKGDRIQVSGPGRGKTPAITLNFSGFDFTPDINITFYEESIDRLYEKILPFVSKEIRDANNT